MEGGRISRNTEGETVETSEQTGARKTPRGEHVWGANEGSVPERRRRKGGERATAKKPAEQPGKAALQENKEGQAGAKTGGESGKRNERRSGKSAKKPGEQTGRKSREKTKRGGRPRKRPARTETGWRENRDAPRETRRRSPRLPSHSQWWCDSRIDTWQPDDDCRGLL